MTFVLDHLAIGNFQDAQHPPAEIDALLCVAEERDIHGSPLLYHKVSVVDMQAIPPDQLKEAVEWIEEHIEDHRIMVFCNAGIGRSVSVVVAYLCCALGFGFGESVEHVATRKPYMSVLPNLILSIEAVKKQRETAGLDA